jgi:hypothetical protein
VCPRQQPREGSKQGPPNNCLQRTRYVGRPAGSLLREPLKHRVGQHWQRQGYVVGHGNPFTQPVESRVRSSSEVPYNHGSRSPNVSNGRRLSPGRELTISGRSGANSCRLPPSPAESRFSDRVARLVMAALQGRESTIFRSGPARLVVALSAAVRSRCGIGAAQQVMGVLSRRSITKSISRVARHVIPVSRATSSE